MSLNHHLKKRWGQGTTTNEGKGNNEENGVKLGKNGSGDLDFVTFEGAEELDC